MGSSRLEVLTEGGVDRNLQAQAVKLVAKVNWLETFELRDFFVVAFPLVRVLEDRQKVVGNFFGPVEKLLSEFPGVASGAEGLKVGFQLGGFAFGAKPSGQGCRVSKLVFKVRPSFVLLPLGPSRA